MPTRLNLRACKQAAVGCASSAMQQYAVPLWHVTGNVVHMMTKWRPSAETASTIAPTPTVTVHLNAWPLYPFQSNLMTARLLTASPRATSVWSNGVNSRQQLTASSCHTQFHCLHTPPSVLPFAHGTFLLLCCPPLARYWKCGAHDDKMATTCRNCQHHCTGPSHHRAFQCLATVHISVTPDDS
jgi:hypothetical protein